MSQICNNCGCMLILGNTWRECDVKSCRYFCIECDSEKRNTHQKLHKKQHAIVSLDWYCRNKLQSRTTTEKSRRKRKLKYPIKTRYNEYKYRAKQKNMKFNLSLKEFEYLILKPCVYCGSNISKYNGIDRVNNIKGYIKENCVPCCMRCNRMKMDMTLNEFIKHLKKIQGVLL